MIRKSDMAFEQVRAVSRAFLDGLQPLDGNYKETALRSGALRHDPQGDPWASFDSGATWFPCRDMRLGNDGPTGIFVLGEEELPLGNASGALALYQYHGSWFGQVIDGGARRFEEISWRER